MRPGPLPSLLALNLSALSMNDAQLLRYSRHLMLNEIDVEGQERLLAARALIVGAGGLGSPAALYLGSAGEGNLTIVDDDTVDATNLQRQIAHTQSRIGLEKALSIREAVQAINPDVVVEPVIARADEALLAKLVPAADVVLDCTDNFLTRQRVNRACVEAGRSLVWGAAIRFDAQLGVYDPRQKDSPCYACTFDPASAPTEERCATMGVFAPLVGMIGSMQAAEAIKLICGMASDLTRSMLLVDARGMRFMPIGLSCRSDCPVCGNPAHGH